MQNFDCCVDLQMTTITDQSVKNITSEVHTCRFFSNNFIHLINSSTNYTRKYFYLTSDVDADLKSKTVVTVSSGIVYDFVRCI